MKKIVLFFALSIIVSLANAQYGVKPIPIHYLNGYAVTSAERASALASLTSPYDLTSSLPSGYVTDGTVSYRYQLQTGINAHNDVLLPNFPVMIDMYGIKLKSNTKVYFQENSKLILKASSAAHYDMIGISSKENITIYFANLEGDRDTHIPDGSTTGEWGMGVSIRNSDNINLIKPKITKCNGDGIYLSNRVPETIGIRIEKGILDNNRRNGLTIISSSKFTVDGLISSNTNGTNPQAGIDFEPNDTTEELSNIIFNDLITFNNYGTGVSMFPRQLLRRSDLLRKDVSIQLNRHRDSLSNRAIGIVTSSLSDAGFSTRLGGYITLNCPIWKSPRTDTFIVIRDPRNNNECGIAMNFPPTMGTIGGVSVLLCNQPGSLETKVRTQLTPLPVNVRVNCSPAIMPCLYLDTASSLARKMLGLRQSKPGNQAIAIVPNPVTDKLKIIADRSLEGFKITITSADGRLVAEKSLQGNDNEVDVSKLTIGLYILKLFKGQEAFYERFVKNN